MRLVTIEIHAAPPWAKWLIGERCNARRAPLEKAMKCGCTLTFELTRQWLARVCRNPDCPEDKVNFIRGTPDLCVCECYARQIADSPLASSKRLARQARFRRVMECSARASQAGMPSRV